MAEVLPAPILFGYSLDVLLYGFLMVQTYMYYLAFPDDKGISKASVYAIFLIGTAQTAVGLRDFQQMFCTISGVEYLIIDGRDPRNFGAMWFNIPISTTLVAIIVQLMYALRIYSNSSKRIIPATLSFLSFVQLVTGIYIAADVYRPGVRRLFSTGSLSGMIMNALVWGILSALSAIIISGYMLPLWWKQLRTTKQSLSFLTWMNRLFLETGLITALLAIMYVVASCFSRSTWFALPGLSLSKIYGNSLLVMLNNRLTIRNGRNAVDSAYDIPVFRGPPSEENDDSHTNQENATNPSGNVDVKVNANKNRNGRGAGVLSSLAFARSIGRSTNASTILSGHRDTATVIIDIRRSVVHDDGSSDISDEKKMVKQVEA